MKISKSTLKNIIREEMEAMSGKDFQPELEKLITIVDEQMDRIPAANRDKVRSALAAKLSAKSDEESEEDT
tara:strand:- start:1063 stop:1275 length:213 start_codon:yes stop_codon:yes gene_type:complete